MLTGLTPPRPRSQSTRASNPGQVSRRATGC